MKIKKILFILLINLMFAGVTIRDGMAFEAPDLEVKLVTNKSLPNSVYDFASREPIELAITVTNKGGPLNIAYVNENTDPFSSEEASLLLQRKLIFTQDGIEVKVNNAFETADTEPGKPPEFIFVETLPASGETGHQFTITIDDCYELYDLFEGVWDIRWEMFISTFADDDIDEIDTDGDGLPEKVVKPGATSLNDPEFPLVGPGGTISLNVEDCCTDGPPQVLTMKYRGLDCSFNSHSQGDNDVFCIDFDALPSTVYIVATNLTGSNTFFAEEVNLDETFDIDAGVGSSLDDQTVVVIYAFENGPRLQQMLFNTSCSVPLITGDQFGSLRTIGCIGEE